MLTVLEDGGMVEIATIGREGMVGVSAVLEYRPVTSTAMVQGETDTCYRMTVEAFRQEMDRRGAFYELLTHYPGMHCGKNLRRSSLSCCSDTGSRCGRSPRRRARSSS